LHRHTGEGFVREALPETLERIHIRFFFFLTRQFRVKSVRFVVWATMPISSEYGLLMSAWRKLRKMMFRETSARSTMTPLIPVTWHAAYMHR
jgi:hypothetical protein